MGSKGASRHRKRFTSPLTYPIARKHYKFTIKATPSGHQTNRSIPISIVLRNFGLAETAREANRIIHAGVIAVDTMVRRDPRYSIGPMDIFSILELGKHYRLIPVQDKRRFKLIEIPEEASTWKLCKVIGKKMVTQGRLQLNLHDGRSIESTEEKSPIWEIGVGDSIKISLPEQEILDHIPRDVGNWIIIEDGSNIGKIGVLESIEKRIGRYRTIAVLKTDKEESVRTSLEYIFPIGKDEPLIEFSTEIAQKPIAEEEIGENED